MRFWVGALEHLPQHVVAVAQAVERYALLLDVRAKPLTSANFKVRVTKDAREMHAEGLWTSRHGDSEARSGTSRVAAQL